MFCVMKLFAKRSSMKSLPSNNQLKILTFPLKSLIDPPGVGSLVPAPNLEKTSVSSRDIPLRYTGGLDGILSSDSISLTFLYVCIKFVRILLVFGRKKI